MNSQDTQETMALETAPQAACRCGPNCTCGPDCACGETAKCDPSCACGE